MGSVYTPLEHVSDQRQDNEAHTLHYQAHVYTTQPIDYSFSFFLLLFEKAIAST
jgi:hypothetical protein